MDYLQFIFSSFWIYLGALVVLIVVTNTTKVVLRKISNEFDKITDIFKKKGSDE